MSIDEMTSVSHSQGVGLRINENKKEKLDLHSSINRTPFADFVTGKRDETSDSDYKDRDWSRMSMHYISGIGPKKKHTGFRKTPPDIIEGGRTAGFRSYCDTSLGGNFPINTLYRYTSTADINMERLYPNFGSGMGSFYYESIEANAHDIHIRFGEQKFNSGMAFFSHWFDYYNFSISTHGRAPGLLYDIGRVAGIALGFAVPSVLMFGIAAKLFGLLGGGRFWYVSPSMPLYWTSVTQIFNELTGAMSMTLPATASDAVDAMKTGAIADQGVGARERNYIDTIAGMLPGVYESAKGSTEEGFTIDIRRVATRAQALESQLNASLQERFSKINTKDGFSEENLTALYDEVFTQLTDGGKDGVYGQKVEYKSRNGTIPRTSLRSYLNSYLESNMGKADTYQKPVGERLDESNKSDGVVTAEEDSMEFIYGVDPDEDKKGLNMNVTNMANTAKGEDESFTGLLVKELRDGAGWLTLRVNGEGTVSESFTNSSEESQISGLINGWAQKRRQFNFNLMGGNILGEVLGGAMGAVRDLAAGTLQGVGFGGLGGFLFGAKIDIAKTYAGSSVSLPTKTYNLKLRTPYGHPLCIAQDLYLPLACLLAGTLPRSAGAAAYGNPFYCEIYDRGRLVVKNGLISSLNVERGTAGVGWTRQGLPLGLDLSFSVENLDTAIHVPLLNIGLLDILEPGSFIDKAFVGNEGAFQDYISVLSGLSLPDMIYKTNTWNRNIYQFSRQWNSYWDKDHLASRIAGSAPANVVRLFFQGTTRR